MVEAGTRDRSRERASSSWARGASALAGCIMLVAGILQLFEGLTALLYGDNSLVRTPTYLFSLSPAAWGWTHLVLGILIAAAGVAIFTGNPVARGLGILLAGLSAIANFLWLPHYPLWASVVLALDMFIIWGLAKSNLGDF
jgi:hypothetical protein